MLNTWDPAGVYAVPALLELSELWGMMARGFDGARRIAVLTQAEAEAYISEPKRFPLPTLVPIAGGSDATYELVGADNATSYLLDVWRGRLRLSRVKLQNRVKVSNVLVRIDDARHTNPDGRQFDGLHIHVYREGAEDKWAEALDPGTFTDTTDLELLFRQFCEFCSIDHSSVTVQVGML